VAVHTYGNVPLIQALLFFYFNPLPGPLIGAFTFLTRLIQIRLGLQTIFHIPVLWAALEYLRSFLLTGFPWPIWVIHNISIFPLSRWLISQEFTVFPSSSFLVNATLFLALHQWAKKTFPFKEFIITAIVLLGFLIYGYMKMEGIDRQMIQNPPLKIRLIQGNIDQSIKWDESFQKETLKIYDRLSLRISEEKPDLIIWPRQPPPLFFRMPRNITLLSWISEKDKRFSPLRTPSIKSKGKVSHYNSAYLLSPLGSE